MSLQRDPTAIEATNSGQHQRREGKYEHLMYAVFDLDVQIASSSVFANHKPPWINGNALCAIISFIDPNKSIRQLKHVVSKAA